MEFVNWTQARLLFVVGPKSVQPYDWSIPLQEQNVHRDRKPLRFPDGAQRF